MEVSVILIVLTDEHILSTRQVCQGCLLATREGRPRWQGGKLGCGHALDRARGHQGALYECQMGFTIADIEA
jgi:hypothetical protein